MSTPKSALSSVRFEPVPVSTSPPPSAWILVLGVIYPAIVIAIELATRMCAESLFDPMPTLWHTLAVALVPAGNLLLWLRRSDSAPRTLARLQFANGVVIAVAGFYSLLFLPLFAIAILVAVIGIGLLPLAPLTSFACALWLLRRLRKRCNRTVSGWSWLGGVATGLVLLLALDIPSAATRLGIQWAASGVPTERQRGLTLLRVLGDDDLLLRLCYDAVGRPTGLLSVLVLFGGTALFDSRQRQLAGSPQEAREIYYRVHGVPFNAKPVPFEKGRWSRFGDFQFDNDHGATQVGGRVKGLTIASSRIDGSISGADALAYLEWTIELSNHAPVDREARLQLALPPGGVVSRATLWVNGEEREAAYAGRGEVRAAYRRLAIEQRRDPLLVTSKGADRILAQAFPVPRNGGSIKFKIGITAPLELETFSMARLTLPAVIDRNFSFPVGASHSVWIESQQPLATPAPGLVASSVAGGAFRVAGSLADRHLSGARPAIRVERKAEARAAIARLGDGEFVLQEVIAEEPQAATVMLVIDGSARVKGAIAQLLAALDAIAPSARVGAMLAVEPVRQVEIAAWSEAQKQAIGRLIKSASYVGGEDNAPALAQAVEALEAEPNSRLLWIHGPQPVAFRDSAARLEQTTARLSRLPVVTLYALEAGPNELLPDAPWAWSASTLPHSGSPESDLSTFLAGATGKAGTLRLRRSQLQAADLLLARGSEHVARLWASERVLALMRAEPTANREAAVALAARYRLVTPVSGAVVLETRQQYQDSGLTPASQATVPTVPEPHEWAMLSIALATLGWLLWRRQATSVA